MANESMSSRWARMDEKIEHIIRTHEDETRQRREDALIFNQLIEKINKAQDQTNARLQRVETAVLTASTSWKVLIKVLAMFAAVMGVFYKIADAVGIHLVMR